MADLRPDLGPALTAFGVAATVTPAGGAPVAVTVIDAGRPTPPAVGSLGMGAQSIVELRKVVAVPRATVPTLPVGSIILADLDGTGAKAWRVDRHHEPPLPDEWRVYVS
jgi:hypothetical protein